MPDHGDFTTQEVRLRWDSEEHLWRAEFADMELAQYGHDPEEAVRYLVVAAASAGYRVWGFGGF